MSDASTIVHNIWRKLPAGPRQRFYEKLTLALAPKATESDALPGSWSPPYTVAGALSAPTGLGESARLLLKGLQALGEDVAAIDLSPRLRQKSFVPVAQTKAPKLGSGTLFLVVQPPNVGSALQAIGRDILRDKRRVGHWVWDLTELPKHWLSSRPYVHDLATPSRFCADLFAHAFGERISILPYPVGIDEYHVQSHMGDIFTFGTAFDLGSTAARKNPMAALDAFERAFPEPNGKVRLSIKIRGEMADMATFAEIERRARRYGSGVQIITGDMTSKELERWWTGIDVFVNLHRSEGFGLLVAEAMLRKIPPIVTDWSATSEYVDSSSGWPIAYDMVPVEDPSGKYVSAHSRWADARIVEAAAAMVAAAEAGRSAAEAKGRSGAEHLRELFGAKEFARSLREGGPVRVASGE